MSCTRGKRWRRGDLQRPAVALHVGPIRVTVAPMLHASGQLEQAWYQCCTLTTNRSERGTNAATWAPSGVAVPVPEQNSGMRSRRISTHARFETCRADVSQRWEDAHPNGHVAW